MKAVLNDDHIPLNNYEFIVLGDVPPLTPISIGSLDDELEVVELPDRTKASGGYRMAGEFELTLPAHHTIENLGMEKWFAEAQGPVAPGYKKECTLVTKTLSGGIGRTYTIHSVFPTKRATSTFEMENVGDISVLVWTMSYDDMLPVT